MPHVVEVVLSCIFKSSNFSAMLFLQCNIEDSVSISLAMKT